MAYVSVYGHGTTHLMVALSTAIYRPWEAWWNTLPAPYLPPMALCAVWPG